MTDDGALLHRIVSPKSKLPKVYEATLAQDLRGDESALFASGTLMLETEQTPLAPAGLEVLGPRHARLEIARRLGAIAGAVRIEGRPEPGWLRAAIALLGLR